MTNNDKVSKPTSDENNKAKRKTMYKKYRKTGEYRIDTNRRNGNDHNERSRQDSNVTARDER